MNIDVGKAIQELLYHNTTVILPGFGGFSATPTSATVDYVQGVIHPPSKKLEFNSNLVTNDGILVNHIQQQELVTAKEATNAIGEYVAKVKQSLEKREIVDIPQVGRLYKDYQQKIRFMPESTNFQIDAHGLPTVSFNPIARQKTPTSAASNTLTPAARRKPSYRGLHDQKQPHWSEKALPWLIVFIGILLAFSLFVWLNDDDQNLQAEVPENRINVKPSQNEDPTPLNNDGDQNNDASTGTDTELTPAENDNTLAKPTPEVSTPVAINKFIVIHSFGVKKNADQFHRTLERGGYSAATKFFNGLHRVGVEVTTTDTIQLNNMVSELGRKFKSTPVPVDY